MSKKRMQRKADNPRQISNAEYTRLQVDLERFGDLSGVIHNIRTGNLVGGNQRFSALDLAAIKPVIVEHYAEPTRTGTVAEGYFTRYGERFIYRQVDWDKETEDHACIAANRDGGAWDWNVLSGWDVTALDDWGFDDDHLRELNDDAANLREWLEAQEDEEIPEDPGAQVDRAEELQEKWQVQAGDIWQIGEHLVICGDCREAATWQRLLNAAGVDKVNGVFTSPPYAEQRKKQYGGVPVAEYVEWWEAVQVNAREHLAADGSFFVNIKPHCEKGERVLYVFDLVLAMKRRWGWRFVDELCWKKNGLPGKFAERFRNDFEPVYHWAQATERVKFEPSHVYVAGPQAMGFIPGDLKNRQGTGRSTRRTRSLDGIRPSNVVRAAVDTSGQSHAAAFPVALPAFFVKAYSDKGDAWLDPFLGSGTTIVAAHQNERRGLGIERFEKYVAVILERLAEVTGLTPERLG